MYLVLSLCSIGADNHYTQSKGYATLVIRDNMTLFSIGTADSLPEKGQELAVGWKSSEATPLSNRLNTLNFFSNLALSLATTGFSGFYDLGYTPLG